MVQKQYDTRFYQLAFLWGFSESALGGIFHAFKLPFTAFVLAAFAMACMAMLATQNNKKTIGTILRALLIVLSLKFAGSPHSPLPAYVAVLFQGIAGAIVFGFMGVNKFSLTLLGFLVMTESAIQKPLVATLLFGDALWLALNEWYARIASFFKLPAVQNISYKIVLAYIVFYAAWGILWGWLLGGLLNKINDKQKVIERLYKKANALLPTIPIKEKEKSKWISRATITLLLVVLLVIYFSSVPAKMQSIVRGLFIIISVYAWVIPLGKYVAGKAINPTLVQNYNQNKPIYTRRITVAFWLSKNKKNTFTKLLSFLFFSIAFLCLPVTNTTKT
jgi:hypothetical protein